MLPTMIAKFWPCINFDAKIEIKSRLWKTWIDSTNVKEIASVD